MHLWADTAGHWLLEKLIQTLYPAGILVKALGCSQLLYRAQIWQGRGSLHQTGSAPSLMQVESNPVSVTSLVHQLQSPWKSSVTLAPPEKTAARSGWGTGKSWGPSELRFYSPLPSITHLPLLNWRYLELLCFFKNKRISS